MTANTALQFICQLANRDEILPLRHAVLRAGQPVASACYRADEMPEALHWGAFPVISDVIIEAAIGCLSLYPQPLPEKVYHLANNFKRNHKDSHTQSASKKFWQLRGMAVAPEFQGKGIGQQLLTAAITDLKEQQARLLWCNARLNAEPFYKKLGFTAVGEAFEIPAIGPHRIMLLPLNVSSVSD